MRLYAFEFVFSCSRTVGSRGSLEVEGWKLEGQREYGTEEASVGRRCEPGSTKPST